MRSTENARPEKCKEYEVHRAAYSHSIKKFPHENFSCKLAKGACVRILHAFRACPLLVSATMTTTCRSDKNTLSTLTAEGLHGIEFDRGAREGEGRRVRKVQSSHSVESICRKFATESTE